jgi:hypothetical protein
MTTDEVKKDDVGLKLREAFSRLDVANSIWWGRLTQLANNVRIDGLSVFEDSAVEKEAT